MVGKYTNGFLTHGERIVLSKLIRKRRKGKTWSELLKETELSKSGLSKVLRRLKNYGFIEEVLIDRGSKSVKVYRARVKNIAEAEINKLLLDFIGYIDEVGSKNKITKRDIKEIKETIEDVLEIAVKIAFYDLLTYKRNIIEEIRNNLTRVIVEIKNKLDKYPHLRDYLIKYLGL